MSLKYYYCKLSRSMHSEEMVQCARLDSASMRSGAWTPSTHTKTRHDTCVYSPSIWWAAGRGSWIPKAHWPVSLTEMAASGSAEMLAQQRCCLRATRQWKRKTPSSGSWVPAQVSTLTLSKVTTNTQGRARPGGGVLHCQLCTGWRKKVTSSDCLGKNFKVI